MVTSYDKHDVEDPFLDMYERLSKLSEYLLDFMRVNAFKPSNYLGMINQFEGFTPKNNASVLISKLSEAYWKYKGFFKFPSEYKGSSFAIFG